VQSDKTYGSAKLKGIEVQDKVCLTKDSKFCVDKFKWFLIEHQKGVGITIDGVVGMSRNSSPPNKKIDRGPLFIKQLKDSG